MARQCIPANPDISGVGVRIAIYAQNLLCFAAVVAHLWDGKISDDELSGVEDQSIGMLAIAFAILISTIVRAAVKISTQPITCFHAGVILDLSWMNNTSTFIWFLLYIHHRSKNNPIAATWSDWGRHLLSPLHHLRAGWSRSQGFVPEKSRTTFLRLILPLLHLAMRAPVLTLGSIHLSLMSSIGIWLWSNPAKFGVSIFCDPSLVIVGGAVQYSSQALRIWSLLVYSLLLIPGVNLVPGFFFFLLLHITYNKSRSQHAQFWIRCQRGSGHIWDAVRYILCSSQNPIWGNVHRRRRTLPSDREAQTDQSQTESVHRPRTAFLIIGLACLAIINVILVADIERTLSYNKKIQFSGENEWEFGQILALLLLVVPLRDLMTSKTAVRRNVAQKGFVKALREAIQGDTFDDYDFQDFIKRGADPNTELEGMKFVTLLQFAAHRGKTSLAKYLLDVKEANPNIQGGEYGTALLAASAAGNIDIVRLLLKKRAQINTVVSGKTYGTALQAASATGNIDIVRLLLEKGADVDLGGGDYENPFQAALREGHLRIAFLLDNNIQAGFSRMAESLKDSKWEARKAIIEGLPSLAPDAEFREKFRICIPTIAECLKDSEWEVRSSAIEGLSIIAAHTEFREEIRMCIPSIVERLKDSESLVRSSAIEVFLSLAAHTEFREKIRMCILDIVERLKDSESSVRRSATEGLSNIAAHAEFRKEIGMCIPAIVECLNSDSLVRSSAIEVLLSLAAHTEFREEIRMCIPAIVECLKNSDSLVRSSAIEGLSLKIAPHAEFREEIRMCIPVIIEYLKDSDWCIRSSAVKGLSNIAAHAEFRKEIGMYIPAIVECLKDPHTLVRSSAIEGLSSLTAHTDLHDEIRKCTSRIAEYLKDFDETIRAKLTYELSNIK